MKLNKNYYKQYKKNGYFVYENLISPKNCDILNKKVPVFFFPTLIAPNTKSANKKIKKKSVINLNLFIF